MDPSVSQEQLLMLGMYRLTPEQEAVYQQFVSLLSSFETIDMVAPITAMLAILNTNGSQPNPFMYIHIYIYIYPLPEKYVHLYV